MVQNLDLFVVCRKYKSDIIDEILEHLQDDDMNGNNGDEYLWECSKAKGFKTNLEFMEDLLKSSEYTKVEDLVCLFMNTLIDKDYYYKDYEIKIYHIDDNRTAVAVMTEGMD